MPVILLTAKSKPEDTMEGMATGADAYMVKPFNTELLKSTIANLLANRKLLKSKFSGAQQQEDKVQKLSMKSADEILMSKIMKVINENLSNPDLNVEMLAANVGLSRVHVHRKLKELDKPFRHVFYQEYPFATGCRTAEREETDSFRSSVCYGVYESVTFLQFFQGGAWDVA